MLADAAQHIAAVDPRMARVIAAVGPCGIELRRGRYCALVRSIVGQQVSVAAARAVNERLRVALGGYVTAERTMGADDEALRACGLSRQKIAYVRDLSARVVDGRLVLSRLGSLENEDVVAALTEVKGVGTWTAEIFLMLVLGRPDVLPLGDLGIRNGFKRVYGLRKEPSAERMQALAAKWRPYRTVGSWYLWRALELDRE
jgi:DNA-3-methyladenine glycosylase II